MTWLALDIGGANLKAADGRGWARSVPFAPWREPQQLAGALGKLVAAAPVAERFAVTMTGELCDCFATKAQGVRHILAAVEQVAGRRDVRVYHVGGRLVSVAEANQSPHLAAASNWHALARFACRFVAGRTGLLIDIGSTTTDVIPLVDSHVAAVGQSDTERLLNRELLYRGIGRTPICAMTGSLPLRGQLCPIAAEVFATTADAYRILGDLDDEPDAAWTADGRPLTHEHVRERLARQLCADATDLAAADFKRIAEAIRDIQIDEVRHCIESAARRMPEPFGTFVLSGSGEFLGRMVLNRMFPGGCRIVSLSEQIGPNASRCAPAHALAVLAREGEKA